MARSAVFIGFGEAGQGLSAACARAFDLKTNDALLRDEKIADYARAGVEGFESAADALGLGSFLTFSLVTADQALAAARSCAPLLAPGSFWFDCNSVAPETKRLAAEAVEAAGAKYVDVAIMAPIEPARLSVPLLISGGDAGEAAALLETLGFSRVEVIGREVGMASAVKMIRSVMVKGLEALSAECILAARRAGVTDAVLASLDASWTEQRWEARVDYNLDRMLVHGLRRAAEMEEAAKTLEAFGVEPVMTRGTIARQRDLGATGERPAAGLAAKLAQIDPETTDQTA